MLASFHGPDEIINAYEVGLSQPDLGLIIVKSALGGSAIESIRTAATMDDPDQRVCGLQEVLYNDIPLLMEAETRITEWARLSLPTNLRIIPTLESPINERKASTSAHFDTATAPGNLIHGPFAFSLGTVGQGTFRGLRFTHKLSDAQLLGNESSSVLEAFEHEHTEGGHFKPEVTTAMAVQVPGDIVLIPGSPRPSLHSVEVPEDTERKSVISSYIITPSPTATASELRRQKIEEREFELQFMVNALRRIRR